MRRITIMSSTTTALRWEFSTLMFLLFLRQFPMAVVVAAADGVAANDNNDENVEFGAKARPYWIAHGTLMFLSWGVIFPVGALIPVYRQYVGYDSSHAYIATSWAPNFYLPHLYVQVTGLILTIIAFLLAARGSSLEYGTGNPFDDVLWDFETELYPNNHHVKWGVSVLIILTIQCILGYVHHLIKHAHDEKVRHGSRIRWKRPIVPSWAHVIIGPLLVMIVAYSTLIQGFQLYVTIYYHTSFAPTGAIKFGYAMVVISMLFFVLAYCYGKRQFAQRSPPAPTIDEKQVEIQPLHPID